MSGMLCTGTTFVKKKSSLVARIVSFDPGGLHLLTFHILGTYPSRDIELDLSHVISPKPCCGGNVGTSRLLCMRLKFTSRYAVKLT